MKQLGLKKHGIKYWVLPIILLVVFLRLVHLVRILPNIMLLQRNWYGQRSSPACKPHFDLATKDENNQTIFINGADAPKFTRLYFHHLRKAGGTSMRYYLKKVALIHNLTFVVNEYGPSEIPGTHSEPTFYVTNLREPVSRSISHFKCKILLNCRLLLRYSCDSCIITLTLITNHPCTHISCHSFWYQDEGRWDCGTIVSNDTSILYLLGRKLNKTAIPNAREKVAIDENKLEIWNRTGGWVDFDCNKTKHKTFTLHVCAHSCYGLWYSGVCPTEGENILTKQHEVAEARLLSYNFIVSNLLVF